MRPRTILVLLALIALPCAAHVPPASGGFDLTVVVDGAPRAEYAHDGTVYIEAVRGASFGLRLTNPTPYRVAVALSVDGLNTIDARHTDPRSAAKWILEPYESTVISGWQVNDRVARAFYFTGERHSYGAALGQTNNLGVIEAVWFRERQPLNAWRERDREESSAPRPAPAGAAAGSAAPAPPPMKQQAESGLSDDYAATGMGRRTDHHVEMVDIDLEDHPVASTRIRYEFHTQLVKLGVLPEHVSPLERRESARGFGAWCPEPK